MKKLILAAFVITLIILVFFSENFQSKNDLPVGDVSTLECRKIVDDFTQNYPHEWEFKYVTSKKLCLIMTREFVNQAVMSKKQLYVTRIIDLALMKAYSTVVEYEDGTFSYEINGNYVKNFDTKKFWEDLE